MHPELSQWHARLNSRRDLMSRPEEHRRELAYDTIALARQDFEAYRISTDVGSVRNQGAQLIQPI